MTPRAYTIAAPAAPCNSLPMTPFANRQRPARNSGLDVPVQTSPHKSAALIACSLALGSALALQFDVARASTTAEAQASALVVMPISVLESLALVPLASLQGKGLGAVAVVVPAATPTAAVATAAGSASGTNNAIASGSQPGASPSGTTAAVPATIASRSNVQAAAPPGTLGGSITAAVTLPSPLAGRDPAGPTRITVAYN